MDKKIRTKYFSVKELRLSIAHMVLWSLLAIAFFTYLVMEIGEKVERGPLYFTLVIVGYVIVLIALTLLFTHRFLGPFERLKTELRLILSGDYHRRLCIRSKDDLYIRSFIAEVDKLLDEFEKMHRLRDEFHENISFELLNIKSLTERKEISKEEIGEIIISLQRKLESILK